MPTNPDKPALLRTLLVLGRISNLPTVWSNCLAGWLIGGSGEWRAFLQLALGASLLYVGGMFLNDACDESFDRQHRTERPIPSGSISGRTVWVLSYVALGAGALLLVFLGRALILPALGLLACIVFYDVVHKQTVYAPVLMAGCRFLLYVVAGAAALGGTSARLLWCAGALAAYIVGLSFIARKEAHQISVCRWSVFLLPVPVLVANVLGGSELPLAGHLSGLALLIWIAWSVRQLVRNKAGFIGQTVSRLLAGIILVDMLAVPDASGAQLVVFALMFGGALLLQRTVPAT